MSTRTARRRVLLVEDHEVVRSLLRDTFPPEDYEVVEAADGAQALDVLRREPFDLVVLDWNLPERSGAEVLADIKRTRPEARVVVLTGQGDAAADLADVFLVKPFSPLKLLDAVEKLLG